jgi:hypothetical protein
MKLAPADRLKLLRFVCSFVWTDLRVTQAERDFVMRVVGRLDLPAVEIRQVESWLASPPEVDALDPEMVPKEHRHLFLQAAQAAVEADGRVVPAEADALALFRELLVGKHQ